MTPAQARACVRAMRVGVAPSNAEALSLGRTAISSVVRRIVTEQASGKGPLLVEGPWGAGKSHALALASATAEELGRPRASIVFDARGVPLSHPNRLYAAIATSIRVGEHRGLRAVLLSAFSARTLPDAAWWTARPGSSLFWTALRTLWTAYADGDKWVFGNRWAWSVMLGTDLVARDDIGRRRRAIERLRQLADWLAECGQGPLLVCGDEVESLANLWNVTARISAYNALGDLLEIASATWVFGAAGNFARIIGYDLENGVRQSWRLRPEGARFLDLWSGGFFQRIAPPSMTLGEARNMADRLSEIYGKAYGPRFSEAVTAPALAEWAQDPARNPRRLARLLVESCDAERA